jgi:nicotinate phosphoribosyltransferase
MQCAVFKFFKDVPVTYAYTNRTPDKKLSRAAFKWLEEQIRSELTTNLLVGYPQD